MLIKKIILLCIATIGSISVLANGFLPVSAPTLIDEVIRIERVRPGYNYAPPIPANEVRHSAELRSPVVETPVVPTTPVIEVAQTEPAAEAPTNAVAVEQPKSDIASFNDSSKLDTLVPTRVPGVFLVSKWLEVPGPALADLAPSPLGASFNRRSNLNGFPKVSRVNGLVSTSELNLASDDFAAQLPAIRPVTYLTAMTPAPMSVFQPIPMQRIPAAPDFTLPAFKDHFIGGINYQARIQVDRSDHSITSLSAKAEVPAPPTFLTAAIMAPITAFEKMRTLAMPAAPDLESPTPNSHEINGGNESTSYVRYSDHNEIPATANTEARHPSLLTAVLFAPLRAFDRMRMLPLPSAPVFEQRTVVTHDISGYDRLDSMRVSGSRPELRRPAADPKMRPILSFVEPLKSTSSISDGPIVALAMEKVNESPLIASMLPKAAGDINVLPASPLPVLVTGTKRYSSEMLRPFGPRPTVPMPDLGDVFAASGGPSSDSLTSPEFDPKSVAPTEVKKAAGPLPVLIGPTLGLSLDLLKPMKPVQANDQPVYESNSRQANYRSSLSSGKVYPDGGFCDPNFVGPPIRFTETVELRLDDLLSQLHSRFGVNFIIGPEVSKLPLNVKAGSIPWNILLRSQLYISGVRSTCIDNNTVELVMNNKVAELEKGRNDAEPLETRYIKLKYLQPSSSGNKNVAGQSTSSSGSSGQGGQGQGGCQQGGVGGQGGQGGSGSGMQSNIPQRCKFERLMSEIRQILGLNDQQGAGLERVDTINDGQSSISLKPREYTKRPYVGQVPGRNMLVVNASPSQLRDIDELIRHADIPPFQVVIKGLVYTANEDKLKDIGVQTTITDTGGNRTSGGIFGHTLGSLGTLFDFSTLIGTIDFNVQASALQRDGVISIKSRPFATVLDGDTTDLTVGRQVPVLIQGTNLVGGAPGTLQILQAANLLSVTPHVIDDENGNPTAVNLELQLESNDVDTSVNSQGVPAVSVRSIQSNFILNQEQTAILGGFTVDSDSKTISKTPGLGDIPILGELFKRRVRSTQINRLYFAISVTVIPYGGNIEPVSVPGATTEVPTLTPALLKRAIEAEPKAVPTPAATPKKDPNR